MATLSAATTTGLVDLTAKRLAEADAPGAVIALVVDGEPWTMAVGHADLARSVPLEASARFPLYSITKTLIATLLLKLIEGEESLGLDDTIQQRLPEFPVERPILLRQALNHTGGLPDYGGLARYHQDLREHPSRPWSPRRFLNETLGDGLLYMPGHGWRYSNIGYMLLRQIAEEESGLPLSLLMRQVLVVPFGLESLGVAIVPADLQQLTPGFSTALNDDHVLEDVTHRYHPGWVAHGLATGTALDTATLLWLLFGEQRVLDEFLMDEMLIGAPVADNHPWMEQPAYGLGVMMDPANQYGVVAGHTGGGPGFSTAAYYLPDVGGSRVSVVAFVNRDGSDAATDLVFMLAEHLASSRKRQVSNRPQSLSTRPRPVDDQPEDSVERM
ncbi:MAG TPA: serine hydrolase domain-containing protein [Thermomicrobiales bacterium]|nr:serine hydrolase domain-containing protein [Thermomicrobiales bacterium]